MRIFLIGFAAILLPACSLVSGDRDGDPGVVGSGSGGTRTYPVADFTAVELRGSDDIDVRVGSAFSVRAEGPSKELEKLRITRDGATLKVGRIDGGGFHWGGSDGKVTVYVTMPRIARGAIAGSGDLAIDRVDGQDFKGDVAGSGDLKIAALAVQSGAFGIAGSGNITVAGTARQVSVDIASSGDFDAAGLKAEGAKVSVAGSGNVRAEVSGAATVSLAGSGDIDLGRNAKCAVSKAGSGDVRCG